MRARCPGCCFSRILIEPYHCLLATYLPTRLTIPGARSIGPTDLFAAIAGIIGIVGSVWINSSAPARGVTLGRYTRPNRAPELYVRRLWPAVDDGKLGYGR